MLFISYNCNTYIQFELVTVQIHKLFPVLYCAVFPSVTIWSKSSFPFATKKIRTRVHITTVLHLLYRCEIWSCMLREDHRLSVCVCVCVCVCGGGGGDDIWALHNDKTHDLYFGWLNQGGWDRWYMWQVQGRREMHALFLLENWRRDLSEDLRLVVRIILKWINYKFLNVIL